MEPKIGGILSIIGGIVLLIYIILILLTAEVVAFFGILQEVYPTLYTIIIAGIMANIFFGFLLLTFGGMFVFGKGTNTIATLMIVIGILVIVFSFVIIGGIVGSVGGLLGMIGGFLSREKKEPEVVSSPSTL